MKWICRVLLAGVVVAANGCGQACDAVLKPGIVLTIVDGATGNPIEEATVIATEGSYSETVTLPSIPPAPGHAILANERSGRYRVEVQAPGYLPWAMSVRVSRDECHVIPVALTARLTRAGAG